MKANGGFFRKTIAGKIHCQQTCPIRRIEESSLDRKKLNGNLDSPKEIKSSIDAKNKVNIKHLFSYFLHYEGSIFKAKK